jgi:hypothetical protein
MTEDEGRPLRGRQTVTPVVYGGIPPEVDMLHDNICLSGEDGPSVDNFDHPGMLKINRTHKNATS